MARPRVVIVGGGFAGLMVARQLRRAPVDITLLDKRNYHLFQPMLYQVATAALSPADIAAPIRHILRNVHNCQVKLGTAVGLDLKQRELLAEDTRIPFDYLVLAAGATHSYFGHPEWEALAPGLKSLDDATEIRCRLLLAFERAEYEPDEAKRQALLTFVVVGAGPTGVEMAGAIKEIATRTLVDDFRHIDSSKARVILVEGSDRLLPSFPRRLSASAERTLRRMGVEVMVNALVTAIDQEGFQIGNQRIAAHNLFWAAGVQANRLGQMLGVPVDRAGRVVVEPDLSVPGEPSIFVVGDMAAAKDARTGQPVPGVAPAALQMGKHVARLIRRELSENDRERTSSKGTSRAPFVYRDKGALATIGKSRAVASIRGWEFSGFPAWILWGGVHVFFLIGFRNRLAVSAKWFWNWIINARDARLITGNRQPDHGPSSR